MKTVIQDKGNSCFKITITKDDEVRIKLQKDSDNRTNENMVKKLTEIASYVCNNKLNTGTLRGKCKASDDSITLYTDSKKFIKKFAIEE